MSSPAAPPILCTQLLLSFNVCAVQKIGRYRGGLRLASWTIHDAQSSAVLLTIAVLHDRFVIICTNRMASSQKGNLLQVSPLPFGCLLYSLLMTTHPSAQGAALGISCPKNGKLPTIALGGFFLDAFATLRVVYSGEMRNWL